MNSVGWWSLFLPCQANLLQEITLFSIWGCFSDKSRNLEKHVKAKLYSGFFPQCQLRSSGASMFLEMEIYLYLVCITSITHFLKYLVYTLLLLYADVIYNKMHIWKWLLTETAADRLKEDLVSLTNTSASHGAIASGHWENCQKCMPKVDPSFTV